MLSFFDFSPAFIVKLYATGLSLIVFYQLLRLGLLGRKLAASRAAGEAYDTYLVESHRSTFHCAFWVAVVAVIMIEMAMRMNGYTYPLNSLLFKAHAAGDVSLVIVVGIVVFRYTGLRNSSVHRRLVYMSVYPLSLFTFGSGLWMLYAN